MSKDICKKVRELLSVFVDNPESIDVSSKKNDNGNLVLVVHILGKDIGKISGPKNKLFDSLKKIIKASLNDENVDLVLDVFGN